MKAVQERKQLVGTKRLEGKVVLVTGGSRGIGAGIALRLAEEGAQVAITYAKNKASAEKVLGEIKELGVDAAAFQADSAAGEQVQLIDEVIKHFGKIDILVNNAGVFEGGPIDSLKLDHYERVFNVNVKGVIATTAAAVKKISDGGRIINLSSVAAKGSMAGYSVYSATKAAVDTLTRVWAQELGARKITVNAVAPGKTALGRVGQPDDIAAVVAFLASDDGRWVTGQSIVADGGLLF
jgi:3-oxoacyl-[acyl-carrier protein] reductase